MKEVIQQVCPLKQNEHLQGEIRKLGNIVMLPIDLAYFKAVGIEMTRKNSKLLDKSEKQIEQTMNKQMAYLYYYQK